MKKNHDRDQQIFDEWNNGADIKKLAFKHDLTYNRVHQIISARKIDLQASMNVNQLEFKYK